MLHSQTDIPGILPRLADSNTGIDSWKHFVITSTLHGEE